MSPGWIPRDAWGQLLPHEIGDGEDVRWWDMAATEPKKGSDPDYTVGLRLRRLPDVHPVTGRQNRYRFVVMDVRRFQKVPSDTENEVAAAAEWDDAEVGRQRVPIYMEQEPGSSGVMATDGFRRRVLLGREFHAMRSTGKKVERAKPVAAAVAGGLCAVVKADWNEAFLGETDAFPQPGVHDDQVDALSGAFAILGIRPEPVAAGPAGSTSESAWMKRSGY